MKRWMALSLCLLLSCHTALGFSFPGAAKSSWEEEEIVEETEGILGGGETQGWFEEALAEGPAGKSLEEAPADAFVSSSPDGELVFAGEGYNGVRLVPEETSVLEGTAAGVFVFHAQDLAPSPDGIYVFSVLADAATRGTLYRMERTPEGDYAPSFMLSMDAGAVETGQGSIPSLHYHLPAELIQGENYTFVVEKTDGGAKEQTEVFFSVKPLTEGTVIEGGTLENGLSWTARCFSPSLPDNLLRVKLEVEGSGAVPAYDLYSNPAPWAGLSLHVEEAVLTGVTKIGEGAFAPLLRLMRLTLPDTLTSLEDFALSAPNLLEVKYPGTLGKLASLCPSQGGNLLNGLYRVFSPSSPWGKENFAYRETQIGMPLCLYEKSTGLGRVMYWDFTLEDLDPSDPGRYEIVFHASGHVTGSLQTTEGSDPGQGAPDYPVLSSVSNLDHTIKEEEELSLLVNLEANRRYRVVVDACHPQDTERVDAWFSIYPKAEGSLVVPEKSFVLAASKKKRTLSLGASAYGKLTYQSDHASVKVSSKGKITIPKNFVGGAVITVTAQAVPPHYEQETAAVSVTVNPAGVKLKTLTSTAAGKAKVSWGTSKTVTGYELSYGNKSDFSDAKTVRVKSTKSSKTLKGLKSGKKVYVRIRTYQTVEGKTYYSAWSGKEKVRVK